MLFFLRFGLNMPADRLGTATALVGAGGMTMTIVGNIFWGWFLSIKARAMSVVEHQGAQCVS